MAKKIKLMVMAVAMIAVSVSISILILDAADYLLSLIATAQDGAF